MLGPAQQSATVSHFFSLSCFHCAQSLCFVYLCDGKHVGLPKNNDFIPPGKCGEANLRHTLYLIFGAPFLFFFFFFGSIAACCTTNAAAQRGLRGDWSSPLYVLDTRSIRGSNGPRLGIHTLPKKKKKKKPKKPYKRQDKRGG
ncbi:hypothetical protein BC940DRAFT_57991 [Gongronella butleri]|nr:hypothetical protein BC940DRAFT_57991 [Gongronella butleri]